MRRLASVIALLVLTAGVASTAGCRKSVLDEPIAWQSELEPGLASARAQKKPVFVYFSAQWQVASKETDEVTLADPEVRALLGRHFVAIHIDETDVDGPLNELANERLHVIGLPTLIILGADGITELARFSQHIPAAVLKRALRSAVKP